ncbi:glucose 1-dehydrogenase [Ensifer adhaerens]|uniref:SDR family NAD(P)-dependent oxidoreductase n=1 Tax=Ensifer adhaerens TaxID=106592 RepID=UPI001CBA6E9C|nr:glucose 1-dehydrogenase [Ensifer adhaerens]MBZ7924834.1 glucose 1-dehydrogenase [Ensifer adhaerens]UAX95948.1 glucose 1-dehydrogenase [Ensifer adhaerens]UAY04710.1 glucose 1-dehydrogenase [Ensifer adhaerens]UAY10141.1 glucose 1-dehydrogenase [Ensifer adhaerens]
MRFKGRTAIVTGGARGFGAAICRRLADEGAKVYVADLQSSDDARLAFLHLDVSKEGDWRAAVSAIDQESDGIDILVNNAGINVYPAAHEIELDDWSRAIAVNQTGVMLGLRHVLPLMLRKGRGSIVNVCSTLGTVAVAGAVAYHATKGAVSQMTRNAAITYAAQGIRVNEVLPGISDTDLVRAQAKEFTDAGLSRTPMARLGKPEEIAAAVVFLASDEASFITGASLAVDGGYLAQ